jgi:hypothetical protein
MTVDDFRKSLTQAKTARCGPYIPTRPTLVVEKGLKPFLGVALGHAGLQDN